MIFIIVGLILSLIGVILLAFGYQTEKTRSKKKEMEFYIEGKLPIVLKYENSCLRWLGWIFIIAGQGLQILGVL